ncbi:MAG: GNAT family N-acetyltransferase [Candidatus Bathyarchaeia archaeon]|jgi:predicted N-acyltransferase
MASTKEVKVFQSVDDIGREAINSIADDAFFTYEWFKTLETQQSFRVSPFYLAVYDEDSLVAFTSCFIDLTDAYFYVGPRLRYVMPFLKKTLIFGRRHGFCQEHILLCYSPYSVRSRILQKKNPEEKLVFNLLAKKIDAICKKERVLFSSFLFVSEFNELLMENLQNFSYLKSPGITTYYLDVRWPSFEDYLKSLKKKTAQNVKREIKKCTENGITIEEQEISQLSATKFSELNYNVNLKYDKNSRNIFDSSFFDMLNEYAKEKTILFVAKRNNEVVGLCLLLRQGDTVDVWMPGFKYDSLTNTDFTYFNLVYYAPIQWAIKEGVRKMYFRNKAEKVKLSRGCKPEKTYSYVKCHDSLLGALINSAFQSPFWSYLSQRLPKRAW